MRIARIDGSAGIKISNGTTWLGTVHGDAHVSASNGDVTIVEAGAGLDAKSACGDIRVGDVSSGTVTLKTGTGTVDLGVREGTAAWLDVASRIGTVTTALDAVGAVDAPAAAAAIVEVHARALGNIAVRRS